MFYMKEKVISSRLFVDKETPELYRKVKSLHSSIPFELVMSDEFNEEGRSFQTGMDPKWTSLTKPGSSAGCYYRIYFEIS